MQQYLELKLFTFETVLMPPNSESTTIDESSVEQMAEKSNNFIVKYRKNYYDITEFMRKHPGGINTLKGIQNGDMTERFMKAPPHSDAAMYLMQEYKIPTTESKTTNKLNGEGRRVRTDNMTILEEVEHDDNNNSSTNNSDKVIRNNVIDESMEVCIHT